MMVAAAEADPGLSGYPTGRVALLNAPHQYVGIDQNFHLPTIRIEIFPADCFVG